MKSDLSRRQFLKMTGTGLAIAAATTSTGFRLLSAAELAKEGQSFHPSVWLEVRPNNSIIVTVNKSEMGQGVYTSLPMIVADELDADWKNVRMEVAPADDAYKDPVWGMQSTGGSSSIRHMYEPLRKAGAAAREMLMLAAARKWTVPLKECAVDKGRVRHIASNRMLTYGKLAADAASLEIPQNPVLKKESQFRYIGKNIPRLDMHDKVNGTALFGIDSFVPGMLYAAIARPPSYEADLLSYDRDAAQAVPGVQAIVPIHSGMAVCADSLDAAWQGRDALKPRWENGRYPNLSNESLEKDFTAYLDVKGLMARNDGDAGRALDSAANKIDAVYQLPYLSHATMEPMNCTISVRPDSCDIWAPTQNQTGVRNLAVKLTGLKPDQIHVHTTFLGGGFGRRFETDYVEEALILSMSMGKPVKLLWKREEDMQHDLYRPMNLSKIQGAVDEQGRATAWSHKIVCPSIFARVFPSMLKNGIDTAAVEGLENMEYEIPNIAVEYVRIDTPVPVGFWRSVGSSHNAFTVESFIDELAHAAAKDPLEFRLGLLKNHPQAKRVLETAAEKAGWGKPLAKGEARGIAYHLSFGSYVAEVAEVSVDRGSGAIKVHKVTCAVDCGSVVNPAIVSAQIMGGLTMGLSAALKEKIEIANGGIKSQNFGDYELLRMNEAPDVDVHIVKSSDKLGGIGEPGVPPIAPAVANAVFQATGARLRQLPMKPDTVLAAMKQG
ncbi:MAG TPA: xanthine dehydrogenase family protein molybdopterin-binding subunit [Nitrospirota bacterium]|nr:xanthine dehydrogenase family protein molybdopterin-binding subunit [Nitrospirota bacterium]